MWERKTTHDTKATWAQEEESRVSKASKMNHLHITEENRPSTESEKLQLQSTQRTILQIQTQTNFGQR